MIRLGAALTFDSDDPEEIVRGHVAAGYTTAVCPPLSLDDPARIRAVRDAFARHDVLLAEVGVWNNLLAPATRRARYTLEKCLPARAGPPARADAAHPRTSAAGAVPGRARQSSVPWG